MKFRFKYKSCKKAFGNIFPTQQFTKKQRLTLRALSKRNLFSKKPRRGKLTDFRSTFYATRSLSLFYGKLSLKTLRKYTREAKRIPGPSTANFLSLLERRLDIALFRLNFAQTVQTAKQAITHGKVFVNRKIVQSPSYILKPGDIVTIDKKFYAKRISQQSTQLNKTEKYDSGHYKTNTLPLKTQAIFLETQKECISSTTPTLRVMRSCESQSVSVVSKKLFAKLSETQRVIQKVTGSLNKKNEVVSVAKLDHRKRIKIAEQNSWRLSTLHLKKYLKKKPLHFEVSYCLGKAILLYTPQVIAFPVQMNPSRLFSRGNSPQYRRTRIDVQAVQTEGKILSKKDHRKKRVFDMIQSFLLRKSAIQKMNQNRQNRAEMKLLRQMNESR